MQRSNKQFTKTNLILTLKMTLQYRLNNQTGSAKLGFLPMKVLWQTNCRNRLWKLLIIWLRRVIKNNRKWYIPNSQTIQATIRMKMTTMTKRLKSQLNRKRIKLALNNVKRRVWTYQSPCITIIILIMLFSKHKTSQNWRSHKQQRDRNTMTLRIVSRMSRQFT